jgi:LysM repeat protein
MKKSILVLIISFFSISLFAQQKIHVVQPKETVYGITHQYGITEKALKEANPFLNQRGLQIGDELVIPGVKADENDGQIKTSVTEPEEVYIPQEDENYIYYKVKPKQTIYSLTKEYGISEAALKSLNPQLEQGLKAGDVIRIPKKQNNTETEIVPEGMHKVERGETVSSLSEKFNVSEDEFYIANPNVQTEGLTVGSYIKIPEKKKDNAVIQDGFIEHKVTQGETIYSITKKYKVTLDELLKYNPDLINGLKTGMTLKIPLQEGANIIKSPGEIKRVDDDKINIALLLPFHLDNAGKSQEKEISTDILMGAKLALDSLAMQGKKINLKVLDSENSSSKIEELVSTTDFSKFDAVVGPLFGTTFKTFANMLSGSGIAVVSPLSNSDDLKEIENVLIATPGDKAVGDAIINEIQTNYKGETIQILTDTQDEDLANYIQDELKNKISVNDIFVTKNVNDLVQKSETSDETLSDGTVVKKEYFTPVITVLVSDDTNLGDSYVQKIKTLSAENLTAYGVKYVPAYDIYNEKNKSNIAALKNIGFTFGTVHLVNIYGGNERETLQDFMDSYCLTPNEYQQLGFDVMYDIVDRMDSRGDVLNSLGNEQTRLSTKFSYKKDGKAYVNQAVRVVRLFVKQDESPDDVEEIKD